MNIKIPNEIIEKIEKRVEESEFKSVEEYILYVLKEVVNEEEIEEQEKENEEEWSEEDEEKVKSRLRSLGYLE